MSIYIGRAIRSYDKDLNKQIDSLTDISLTTMLDYSYMLENRHVGRRTKEYEKKKMNNICDLQNRVGLYDEWQV